MTGPLGVKNGILRVFQSSITSKTKECIPEVIKGGMKKTLLPLGIDLLTRQCTDPIKKRDHFALVIDNDSTSVACLLAAMELECTCVLLSKSRLGILNHVIEQTGVTKVLYTKANGEVDMETIPSNPIITSIDEQEKWYNSPPLSSKGGVCLLTSGSVGKPKVVACSWDSMLLQGQCTNEQLFPSRPARLLCGTSISHAYSINAIFALYTSPFDEDSELCFASEIHGFESLLQTKSDKFTLLFGTPGTYTHLLSRPIVSPLILDVAYCAGTPLASDLFIATEKLSGLQLMQNYGSTETGNIAAWNLFGRSFEMETIQMKADELYVGSLWSGVDVKLSEKGELLVKTPWQSVGYVKKGRLMSHEGKPHHTADRGRLEPSKNVSSLFLEGRIRSLIEVIDGNKPGFYAPEILEEAFLKHGDITDALVLNSEIPGIQARLVLRDGATCNVESIQKWCEEKLPCQARPSTIELVEYLPCSPAGKLMYS
jgi:long-chain acyl-CoA synthetase